MSRSTPRSRPLSPLATILLTGLLSACSASDIGEGALDGVTGGDASFGLDALFGQDAGGGDAGSGGADDAQAGGDEDATTSPEDAAGREGDSGGGDDVGGDDTAAGGGCEFPAEPLAGEPGAACSNGGDCNSGFCVEGPEGRVCTATCVDCCPSGFRCEAAPGRDATFICVPKLVALCRPCASDAECGALSDGALCVDYGDDGRFCGGGCDDNNDCPAATTCQLVEGTQGAGKQCVRTEGVCTCSESATLVGAQTTCAVTNDLGSCEGTRKCGIDGLTACDAPTPVTETCNGVDDDCDGQTDEGVVLGSCTVDNALGSCPGAQACVDGALTCVGTPAEAETCNGLDDNCDGQPDEGCDDDSDGYCDAALPIAAGALCVQGGGDCADDNADVNPGAPETCNDVDDNCNGLVDAADGTLALSPLPACDKTEGVCAGAAVTTQLCVQGSWLACEASAYGPDYEAAETRCDGLDNDCDGQTDEGCDDDQDGFCEAGLPVFGAPAVCPQGQGDCDDNNPAANPLAAELCSGVDEDCDGKTDGLDGDLIFAPPVACEVAEGACAGATKPPGLCSAGAWAPCTVADYAGQKGYESIEQSCDDIDNDCDGLTDEGCDDDGDGYCEAGLTIVGLPKACPKGGGDCNDQIKAIAPGGVEVCDDIDQDCDGQADEGCDVDGDGYCDANKLVLGQPAVCPNGPNDCDDGNKLVSPGALDVCDGLDNNCGGGVDELCDKDKDGYCGDDIPVIGNPQSCFKGTGDCDDNNPAISPAAAEVCDDLDNDCKGGPDNGCDDDSDGYCDENAVIIGQPAVCPAGTGDCNDGDGAIAPGKAESCDGVDQDCDGQADEGCDDDNDGFCDAALPFAGSPPTCQLGPGDCNDDSSAANPNATEVCNGLDDNCDGQTDEGCDDDNDGYCDEAMLVFGQPPVCPMGGGDCDDGSSATNPGAADDCDGVDDDCSGVVDAPLAPNACASGLKCVGGSCVQACNAGSQTFNPTGSQQALTLPSDCSTFIIEAWGAQGGNEQSGKGGNGAYVKATFTGGEGAALSGAGVHIRVGQQGSKGTCSLCGGGGGGGSFVTLQSNGAPLVVAGGGGGASYQGDPGQIGLTSETGGPGGYSSVAVTQGGTTDNGGGGGTGCGGGGWAGNGKGNSWCGGGQSKGGTGGTSKYTGSGGYGGGGGAYHGGGGGGGYTGGSGGTYTKGGGGGGSYASTSNKTMQAGTKSGGGQVKISWQ